MVERLNLSNEEYFALFAASNSELRKADELFKSKENFIDPTKAYRFGSALDALATDINDLKIKGMDDDEVKLLFPMRRALIKNPIYQALFAGQDTQAVFYDPQFPVNLDGREVTIPAKCKYDLWNEKLDKRKKFGGDLKSTDANSDQAFRDAIKFFQYNKQGAWYMDITRTDRFIIIGVSKRNFKTFVVQIRRGDKMYESGKKLYQQQAVSWWILNQGRLGSE